MLATSSSLPRVRQLSSGDIAIWLRPSRRHLSTSRCLSAPFSYTALPSRSLLPIWGVDAPKFLQGLISNDVHHLGKSGTSTERALFAAMLRADGRLLYDIFLYPYTHTDGTPGYLLDYPTSPLAPASSDDASTETKQNLRSYLRRHILRSKVKVGPEGYRDRTVFAAWRTGLNQVEENELEGDKHEVEEAEQWLESVAKAGQDTRAPGMGWRWAGEVSGDDPVLKPPEGLFDVVHPSHHHLHRLLLAVPEGPEDYPPLPLEGNLELMGGVDYRKGCYVGQELTARTKHKGVVRKRGVAVRLFREGEDVPSSLAPRLPPLLPYPSLFPLPAPQTPLTPFTPQASSDPSFTTPRSRARPTGKLGSSLPVVNRAGSSTAFGFASVRLDTLEEKGDVFVVKARDTEQQGEMSEVAEGEGQEGEGRWLAKAFVPEWLKAKLADQPR